MRDFYLLLSIINKHLISRQDQKFNSKDRETHLSRYIIHFNILHNNNNNK